MSIIRRIVKNTTVLTVSQLISYILSFFALMYTARYLGVVGFGNLSFAFSLTGILVVIADLGLSNLAIREIAREKSFASNYLGTMLIIKILLSVLTFAIIAGFVNIFNYPEETIWIVYLIGLSLIINSFIGIFYSVFQAYEKMEYQSIGTIMSSALTFLGIIYVIVQNLGIIPFSMIYVVVSFIVLIYAVFICLWKFTIPKINFNFAFWKLLIIKALPFSLALIFAATAFKVDTVILSFLKGDVAVGLYSAPYKLMEILIVIPSLFAATLYPLLSQFYIDSQKSLIYSYEKSFKFLTLISLPIAVGTTLLSYNVINLIYGEEFDPAVITLQILIWTIPFIFINYLFSTIYASIDRQNLLSRITFVNMAFNIALNLILVPFYSYIGAAVATVATEAFSFTLRYRYIPSFLEGTKLRTVLFKPTIGCIFMSIFILIFIRMNTALLIIFSAFIYFTVLIILKTFTKDEIDLIRGLIK